MRRLVFAMGVLACLAGIAACGPSGDAVATFSRTWEDGRLETLELFADGRVLMDHNGNLERLTIAAGDVDRLVASMANVVPAADPTAYPRLTLTTAGASPVVVQADPGTAGELYLSLLDRHALP